MSQVIIDPNETFLMVDLVSKIISKKLVKLQATVPPNSYGFDINLHCGPLSHDDIVLQISVRLLDGCEYIGLKSREDGIWGEETRFPNVLTDANQEFEIIVLREFNQYKIIINNEELCTFPEKIGSKEFTHVSINGSVSNIQNSFQSICDDLISALPSVENQFYTGNDSNQPPSYESAVNDNDDVESQTVQEARVAIFHFKRETIKRTSQYKVVIWLVALAVFGFSFSAGYFKRKCY